MFSAVNFLPVLSIIAITAYNVLTKILSKAIVYTAYFGCSGAYVVDVVHNCTAQNSWQLHSKCPPNSCRNPVIPADSGGFQRNEIWQGGLLFSPFRCLTIPVEFGHSGIDTGMIRGMHRNGMQRNPVLCLLRSETAGPNGLSLVEVTFCDTGLSEIHCVDLGVDRHLPASSSLPFLIVHPAYIAFTLVTIRLICIIKFFIFNHNLVHTSKPRSARGEKCASQLGDGDESRVNEDQPKRRCTSNIPPTPGPDPQVLVAHHPQVLLSRYQLHRLPFHIIMLNFQQLCL
ncbi:uncharacterized protein LACBIDRAFT_295669 [Laccaria bicolor S238N-H82]|uniref:Predicted protein n=1 Tax=Laccaria bicolor (strain S238N-H82 / ATCC MYA-4686) TaxID=486041 RepID=B0DWV7_LACBS|nr:uncharacterized protein LACBIDRAFT_295669 [Laccaria bicolor S238N-H82]EDR00827.1 predicted protein [Laccaria bicolor S238N-H82]|eukprot:XP_001888421.1 predicted protein [Laccaria bicolor S238N-H82]